MLESNTYLFNWLGVSGLRVGQVVDGDGEEDVEQGVVPKQGEHDEVEAENDDIYECCEGVGKKVARQ